MLPISARALRRRDCVSILTRPEGRVLRSVAQRTPPLATVSILTRPEGRVLPVCKAPPNPLQKVSILTRPEGRVLRRPRRTKASLMPVSILTRPEGRVLRALGDCTDPADWFQSSPGPKAGCYTGDADCIHEYELVSILTRPEGRVLLAVAPYNTGTYGRFQSSPGPKAGCYLVCLRRPDCGRRFQSSPGPKAGCYRRSSARTAWPSLVSILTRPEGRVLPPAGRPAPPPTSRFNPHPARRPGATWVTDPASAIPIAFQSSPGPKAGCYARRPSRASGMTGFNPHPARRPGATYLHAAAEDGVAGFQSSPGPKAGCYASLR